LAGRDDRLIDVFPWRLNASMRWEEIDDDPDCEIACTYKWTIISDNCRSALLAIGQLNAIHLFFFEIKNAIHQSSRPL
jgi:hypothetical protein